MDLNREWQRFRDMIDVALHRGWRINVAAWQDREAALTLAKDAFELYDVPPGRALFLPVGKTPEGRDAVLALSNAGYVGCMMVRDGLPGWVGTIKEAFTSRAAESVTQYDGRKGVGALRCDRIPYGTRCFGSAGKADALLCISAGDGLIQTVMGGPLMPWRDLVSSLTVLEGRDGGFDNMWREGRTQYKSYMGLRGALAASQRKYNGQRGGEKTIPGQSLGPARIILPGEAQAAASAPQIAPQRPVEPAPSNVVSFTPPAAQPSARQPHFDEGYEVWIDWRAKHGTPDADGIAPAWRVEGDTEGRWTYISSVATMLLDEVNDGPDDMYRKMRPAGFGARAVNAWLDAQEDARGKPISWRG